MILLTFCGMLDGRGPHCPHGHPWYALWDRLGQQRILMKQLDVVVNPPAFVWDPYLTLTNGILIWPWLMWLWSWPMLPKSNGSRDMNFYIFFFGTSEFLCNELFSSHRQTDRQKAMHKSPLCISTDGLKNQLRYKVTMIHSPQKEMPRLVHGLPWPNNGATSQAPHVITELSSGGPDM